MGGRALVGQVGVRVGQQGAQGDVSDGRGGASVLDLVEGARDDAELRVGSVAYLDHQRDAHDAL